MPETPDLNQRYEELLARAATEPGAADALLLQKKLTEAATLNEEIVLAYEPQAQYGSSFSYNLAGNR